MAQKAARLLQFLVYLRGAVAVRRCRERRSRGPAALNVGKALRDVLFFPDELISGKNSDIHSRGV